MCGSVVDSGPGLWWEVTTEKVFGGSKETGLLDNDSRVSLCLSYETKNKAVHFSEPLLTNIFLQQSGKLNINISISFAHKVSFIILKAAGANYVSRKVTSSRGILLQATSLHMQSFTLEFANWLQYLASKRVVKGLADLLPKNYFGRLFLWLSLSSIKSHLNAVNTHHRHWWHWII